VDVAEAIEAAHSGASRILVPDHGATFSLIRPASFIPTPRLIHIALNRAGPDFLYLGFEREQVVEMPDAALLFRLHIPELAWGVLYPVLTTDEAISRPLSSFEKPRRALLSGEVPALPVDVFHQAHGFIVYDPSFIPEREQIFTGRGQSDELHLAAIRSDVVTVFPIQGETPTL
jgi:hypothetical protein